MTIVAQWVRHYADEPATTAHWADLARRVADRLDAREAESMAEVKAEARRRAVRLLQTVHPIRSDVVASPTAGRTRGVQPPKLRRLDVARMARTEPAPVPWVARPVLARSALTMIAGQPGAGKSMFALGLAAAITTGAPFAGLPVRSGRVLYVDAENGEREAHRRIRGLEAEASALDYFEATEGFSLRGDMGLLYDVVIASAPALVVLDSLRSLAPGMDENDSAAVEDALRPVVRLAQRLDIAVLLLHHAGKVGSGYRGSTAIGAALELGFTLERDEDDPEERTRRRLSCWKSRPAMEPDPMWLSITSEGGQIRIADADAPDEPAAASQQEDRRTSVDDAAEKLAAVLEDSPLSWPQWAEAAGLDNKNGTVRRARNRLKEEGVASFELGEGFRRA